MQEDLRPVRGAAAVAAAATVRGSRSMWLPLRSKHQGLVSFGLPAHCKLLPWPCRWRMRLRTAGWMLCNSIAAAAAADAVAVAAAEWNWIGKRGLNTDLPVGLL